MLKIESRSNFENPSSAKDELLDMDERHSDNVFLSQADLDSLSLDSNNTSFGKHTFSEDSVEGGDFDLSELLDTETISQTDKCPVKIEETFPAQRSKSSNNVLNSRQTGEVSSGEKAPAVGTSDVIGAGQSSMADGRSEEEERRLVLASVKHVDCHDFPFEEVLSLEETVLQKGASLNQVASASQTSVYSKTDSSTPETMKDRGSVTIISHAPLPGSLDSAMHVPKERKNKRRPPLLKCQTWPRQDSTEDESSYIQTTVNSSHSSKLDSPSFYSQSAIDFSAISHLSEEHDKMMAQEMSEAPQPQHPFISATTKERLYGKATKSRAQSQRSKSYKENSRGSAIKISSSSSDFTVTHTKPNASIVSTRRHTVGDFQSSVNDKNAVGSNRKSTKAVMSPLEKAFRKQYTIASRSGSPVVPSISTLPTEATAAVDSASVVSDRAEAKKPGQMQMEKQPLPPEGFKITRYPIKANASVIAPTSPTSSAETPEEGSTSESDLHQVIKNLKKQHKEAEDRIALAEKQAKEWKEIAQQTLRAAQVIKAQMEFEKVRANRAEGRSSSTGNDTSNPAHSEKQTPLGLSQQSGDTHRRWSNEVSSRAREGVTITRHRLLSTDATELNVPAVKRSSSRGRKRSGNMYTVSHRDASPKRTRLAENPLPVENEQQKQQSLLNWLTSTETEASDISYMSLLECPPAASSNAKLPASSSAVTTRKRNPPLAMTSRSLSHEEVRAALRAKVEHSRTNVMQADFESSPANKTQNDAEKLNNDAVRMETDQYFRTSSYSSEIFQNYSSTLPNDEDDVLSDLLLSDNDVVPSSPELLHSLSDSELQMPEKRATQAVNTKPTLSKKLSSSEGFLANIQNLHPFPPTVTNDTSKYDSDFLSQLDCFFGL
uniref:Uncharacterized protein LOC100187156 n=1 Tax=Phallusia mammillata TaxID=59560 RepID=A0A6F9DJG7_9ASCI|nr:uncharacterized protein LOC100187156 [Phallusia mammillata]